MGNDLDRVRLKGLDYLRAVFGEEPVERAVGLTGKFEVEIPAWQFWAGFGGGGRFGSRGTGGAARDTEEIAEDAALVHRLTRSAPTVGQHVLWFLSHDGVTGDLDIARRVAGELEARV